MFDEPSSVAVDGAGNLLIDDSNNERVRVVAAHTGTFYGQAMTAGDIYTVAGDGDFRFLGNGTPATHSGFDAEEISLDSHGNLLIADSAGNVRILVVPVHGGTFYGLAMTAGDTYAVAGDGTQGFSGDGGRATSGELDDPQVVVADGTGDLFIADNNLIREVSG